MTLLAKLDYDQAPDVGPHVDLDSLQTREVKRIIARALRSYNNWCSPDGPRVTREQEFLLESHLCAMMVLPGCKYIVVQSLNNDYFGVWDITQERVIARHLCPGSLRGRQHDCALLEGEATIRVAYLRDIQE